MRKLAVVTLCVPALLVGVAARAQTPPPPAAPGPGDARSPGATPATTPAAPPGTAPAASPPAASPGAPGTTTTGMPPGASAPSAAPEPTPPAEVTVPSVDETYGRKIKELEDRVSELKEKVHRSKTRLILLQETVLSGAITGARAVLVHKNEMGSSYKIEHASYHLDGRPIYQPSEGTDISDKREFPLFNGTIVPGSHTISVYLVYRGTSAVFKYWEGYRFKIKSSYTFHAEEGKVTTIKCVGYEKGGVTTDPKDRPSVRYDVDVAKETRGLRQAPGAATPAEPKSEDQGGAGGSGAEAGAGIAHAIPVTAEHTACSSHRAPR